MPSKTIILRSKHEGFAFRAYHAWPDCPAKGGLVLVQEIFGVTDHIRELCDQYAADGYDVIAPSLYDRQERGFEASYDQQGIEQAVKLRDGHDMKYSVGDVQACIDFLRDERHQTKVFITGYCYGGTFHGSPHAAAQASTPPAAITDAALSTTSSKHRSARSSCTMAAPTPRSRWIRSSALPPNTQKFPFTSTKRDMASIRTVAPTTALKAPNLHASVRSIFSRASNHEPLHCPGSRNCCIV